MKIQWFLLISTIKNIYSYNADRKVQTITSATNKKIEVTPARYQVANKNTHSENIVTPNFQMEYFPEVEYPTSVMESSKPFYSNASPFPKDVISSFDTMTLPTKKKVKNDILKNAVLRFPKKVKTEASSAADNNDINNMTLTDRITNITVIEQPITLDFENKRDIFENGTSIQESDEEYVLDLINDYVIDEIITNLNEVQILDCTPSEHNVTALDHLDDMQTILDRILKNNETVIELNGDSFPSLECKDEMLNDILYDNFDPTISPNVTSYLYTNDSVITYVDNLQDGICEILQTSNLTMGQI